MDSVQILLRTYFSIIHIQSAARMARLAWAVEQQFAGEYNQELNSQDKAFSTAAVYGATSFLEASINELFHDAAEQPNLERLQGFNTNVVNDLARYVNNRTVWNAYKSAKNAAYRTAGTYGNEILNKFQFAAVCCGLPELAETDTRFTQTRLLIDVRNKLTHYEPETVAVHDSEGPVTLQDISQRLNGSFPINPFSSAGNHNVFPSLYLSHGAAEWAVHTAFGFADWFSDHVNLPKQYGSVRAGCVTR